MNPLEKLKKCCYLRGLNQSLIHRTIHEFDWFCSAVIWGENSDIPEEREVHEKYKYFHYNGDTTLEKWIDAFYEYCKEEYE